MPEGLRHNLIRRMAALKPVSASAMRLLESSMHDALLTLLSKNAANETNVRIADILNRMEREIIDEILNNIEEARPDTAKALKRLLFRFEDISRLTPKARMTVFDEVPAEQVVLALRGTEAEFEELVLSSMASRARRMVEEAELQSTDEPDPRAVGDARRSIANRIMELGAKGEIDINFSENEQGHLGFSMAETADRDSKTEEPTERRIREATEKGNIPVSREAPIFASMVGILAIASLFLADRSVQLSFVLRRILDDPGSRSLENGSDAGQLVAAVGSEVGRFLVPVIATLTLAGLAASFLQNAPSLRSTASSPQLSRISPQEGARRIFGLRGQAEFLKATIKFVAVAIVVLIILKSDQQRVIGSMYAESAIRTDPLALHEATRGTVSDATIVIVAVDLVWARISWRRDLRMTRQELKDEFKQTEGDPLVKARLKSLARDRNRRHMIAALPRATLVIVNPTHYAVALRYNRPGRWRSAGRRKGPGPDRAQDQGDRGGARHSDRGRQASRKVPLRQCRGRPHDSAGVLQGLGGDHPLPAEQEPREGESMMTGIESLLQRDRHAADRESASRRRQGNSRRSCG